MFRKNLGGIIQVGDSDEEVTGFPEQTPVLPELPGSEDIWISDEEKAAKQALREKTTVIGPEAVFTGDMTATGPVEINGTMNGNISCEEQVTIYGQVMGDISGKNVQVADGGKVRGNITFSGSLTLEAGASVEGDLSGGEINLEGTLTGNINCSGSLTLGSGSVVAGDIDTEGITAALGAKINGKVKMKQ
jgi:cytoskeletal protein CcmA (bactofilin family)